MRKIITAMIVMIFSAIAMMGCATSSSIKALDNKVQKIASMVEEHDQFIQVDFDQKLKGTDAKIADLQETDEEVLGRLNEINGGIDQIKTSLGLETTAVTAAAKEVTPFKKVSKKLKVPKIVSGKAPKVKVTETLEYRLASLTKQVDGHETRLNTHGKQLSDLQRLMAEAEDEFRHDKPQKYYFWTTPFRYTKAGSSKLTEEIKEGLDMLVVDLLAGKIQLQKEVVGYTDPRGKKKFNEELAKKRATSCIKYLVKELGPGDTVKWDPNTKWKEYFISVAGGEIDRYGSFKYSRRVRFERRTSE